MDLQSSDFAPQQQHQQQQQQSEQQENQLEQDENNQNQIMKMDEIKTSDKQTDDQEDYDKNIQSFAKKQQPLKLDEQKKQIILRNQIFVFVLTFLAYAAIHATRTAWSSSKQSLKEDLDEKDDHFLGLVDTSFLLCYAISMKVLGSYSGFGMISASVCLLIIYFICQVSINKGFILFMMMINGISQSTGWPSVVACMGNWFGNGKKGLLMGLWGTNGNVGNMLGYFIQDFAVNTLELNWKFVLFIIGLFLLIIGSIVIFNLEPYPNKLGISQEELDLFQEMQSRKQGDQSIQMQQKKGDHYELNEDLEAEKRNQTIVLEMPIYKEFNDNNGNDYESQNDNNLQQNEINHEQNNNEIQQKNEINHNNINHIQQASITEADSKDKINTNLSSPGNDKKQKNNNLIKNNNNDEEDDEYSQNNPNNINDNIFNDDNNHNDSLKINSKNEQDTVIQKYSIDANNYYQSDLSNENKDKNQEINQQIKSPQEQNKPEEEDKLNLFNAWIKVPGLAIFALTQGGVKGTIYGLMFWLPIYLQEHDLKNQAAFICSMNEIGTFAGGLILGVLIDKFKMKAAIITLFLGISSIIMFIIHFLPSGVAGPYYILVLLGGICLGGPYTMLGGAIAIELSQQPEVRHYKNVTALLAGVIEGFGSFVAAFVQIIIPFFGQKYIFILFTFSSFFSSFFLVKKAIQEIKSSPYFKY